MIKRIGVCRPRSVGLYTVEGAVMLSVDMKQVWSFKYGMMNGITVVKLSRDNVRLYLSKEDFECDWRVDNGSK